MSAMSHSRISSARRKSSSSRRREGGGFGNFGSGPSRSATTASESSPVRRAPKPMDRAELEDRLGHRFSDPSLLTRALSHASAGNASNERLEFLGDRVLGLVVAERLYAEYPHESEGGLAVRLNALVRREACAKIAEEAGLAPHLIMAVSE